MDKRTITARARAALKRAVGRYKSQADFARACGFKRQNLHRMLKTGHVPSKHLRLLEEKSGEPREEFRADLYER